MKHASYISRTPRTIDDLDGPDDGGSSELIEMVKGVPSPPYYSPFPTHPSGDLSLYGMVTVSGPCCFPLQRTYTGEAPSSKCWRVRVTVRSDMLHSPCSCISDKLWTDRIRLRSLNYSIIKLVMQHPCCCTRS